MYLILIIMVTATISHTFVICKEGVQIDTIYDLLLLDFCFSQHQKFLELIEVVFDVVCNSVEFLFLQ